MTEDELREFAARVRAECDAALAELATVDPAAPLAATLASPVKVLTSGNL